MAAACSVPLAQVAALNPRLLNALSDGTPVSFVPMASVSAEEARVTLPVERPYAEVRKGYTYFETGDVLVAKITPCFENGKIAQAVLPHQYGFGSTEFHVVRPTSGKLESRYLHHFLRQARIRVEGERRMTGSGGQRRVPEDFLAQLSIPLPPLPEQRRIAAILDQADALRAKRREALAQLDSLTQSIFIEMFGDPVGNDRNWRTAKVSSLCQLVRGSSPRPQGDPRYFGGPVPRLMIADITRDGWLVTPRIDSLTIEGATKSRPVRAGTVVMAVSGNIGLVSRLAVDACVHDGFVAFNELDAAVCDASYFLALLHLSKAAHERSKAGAIFINLTTDDIKAMLVPTPPLALQQSFATRIQAVESLKATHRAALAELDALFASLQHRAFSGGL